MRLALSEFILRFKETMPPMPSLWKSLTVFVIVAIQTPSARINGVCPATVTNTVKLFANEGISGITNLKRNANSDNTRRKLDGRAEARIIEIACGPVPEGHARWTLRLLEEKARMELDVPVGKNAIGRALKKTGLDLTKTVTGASPKKKTRNL